MHRGLALGILGAVLQLTAASECSAEESPLPNADYGISTIWQLGGIGGLDYLALEPGGARLSSAGAIAWMWSKPPAGGVPVSLPIRRACMASRSRRN